MIWEGESRTVVRRRASLHCILALRKHVGRGSPIVLAIAAGTIVLLMFLILIEEQRGAPTAFTPASCIWHDTPLQVEEQRAVATAWASNVSHRYAIVRPSRAYAGVWLRDSFWTFLAVGDAQLSGRSLHHFAARQRASGQVPTQFVDFLRQPLYRTDESTLLYLIWSDWQAQHHGWQPPRPSLTRALAYVQRQAPYGWYVSQAGADADWSDGYRLPRADTLSYTQGLYVDALLAARAEGLPVPSGQVDAAVAHYRALADPQHGYLRFSRLQAYHDISGLTGEFLAVWLFKRPLLSDATVAATLQTQPPAGDGFRVVTNADGTYLSPHLFVTHEFPGDYQNGGSWLLYDYVGLATGCLHHVSGMGAAMAARLRLEFRHGAVLHEYPNTDPSSPLAGTEPAFRDNFSWDTFIVQVDRYLRTWGLPSATPEPGTSTHVSESDGSARMPFRSGVLAMSSG